MKRYAASVVSRAVMVSPAGWASSTVCSMGGFYRRDAAPAMFHFGFENHPQKSGWPAPGNSVQLPFAGATAGTKRTDQSNMSQPSSQILLVGDDPEVLDVLSAALRNDHVALRFART